MTNSLRKAPGTPAARGMYTIAAPLPAGLTPGERVVKDLTVLGTPEAPVTDVSVLAGFEHLEDLRLEHVRGADLAVLAPLVVGGLSLVHADGVDLGAIEAFTTLDLLMLSDVGACTVPEELTLPASLRHLDISATTTQADLDTVRRLVEAIAWERLRDLKGLTLKVGGLHFGGFVEVDLGFLRHLPHLERLEMPEGILHAGPGPSPIEPPFEGLARGLTWMRISAPDPDRRREQLQDYLGLPRDPLGEVPVVYEHLPIPAGPPADPDGFPLWTVDEEDDGSWSTYGTLYDTALGDGVETEYEACDNAQRKLSERDPDLAARIEFDPENAGTGIAAPTHEDLVRALEILGLDAR